jgi:hypothetical protein
MPQKSTGKNDFCASSNVSLAFGTDSLIVPYVDFAERSADLQSRDLSEYVGLPVEIPSRDQLGKIARNALLLNQRAISPVPIVFPSPKLFAKAVAVVRHIAQFFRAIRVDIYIANGRIVVGEITPNAGGGGFGSFDPPFWDARLGEVMLSNCPGLADSDEATQALEDDRWLVATLEFLLGLKSQYQSYDERERFVRIGDEFLTWQKELNQKAYALGLQGTSAAGTVQGTAPGTDPNRTAPGTDSQGAAQGTALQRPDSQGTDSQITTQGAASQRPDSQGTVQGTAPGTDPNRTAPGTDSQGTVQGTDSQVLSQWTGLQGSKWAILRRYFLDGLPTIVQSREYVAFSGERQVLTQAQKTKLVDDIAALMKKIEERTAEIDAADKRMHYRERYKQNGMKAIRLTLDYMNRPSALDLLRKQF